jgi:hypothetical protein
MQINIKMKINGHPVRIEILLFGSHASREITTTFIVKFNTRLTLTAP